MNQFITTTKMATKKTDKPYKKSKYIPNDGLGNPIKKGKK